MRPELHIDFETRATLDLKKVGLYAYAEHQHTGIWCASYAVDDDLVEHWQPDDLMVPHAISDAVREGWSIYAHNANFERQLWLRQLCRRHGWPAPVLEQFYCTAAMAAEMALPRDLARAAQAMGIADQKDEAGHRLMLQMMKPRKMVDGKPVWWDVPEKVERLIAYCDQDVRTERGLTKRLRPLSDFERRLWLMDQRINDRGIAVDLEAVRNAQAIVRKAEAALDDELARLTGRRVEGATKVGQLKDWIRAQGVTIADEALDVDCMDKAAIRQLLKLDLPPKVRRAIEIRAEAAKSSNAKLEAFKARTQADGRTRDTLMFCATHTRRWGGRGIQPHNFPRSTIKPKQIPAILEAMATGDPHWLEMWGKPLDVISGVLKANFTAAPGHELVRADYSNIEGRVLAWLAGEEWKLQAFRDYDAGTGPDLYIKSAAETFGVAVMDISKEDPRRQIGKVSELSLGYQGGHGAFVAMAKNYEITPAEIAPVVKRASDPDLWATTSEGFEEANRYELPHDEWVALRIIIDRWRLAHPAIAARAAPETGAPGGFWAQLEAAAYSATCNPGRAYWAGRIAFACRAGVLWMQLASGGRLAYIDPKVKDVETPWGSKKSAVTFMGVDDKNRWCRQKTYGGFWAAHATQSTARDIMGAGMLRAEEEHGWPVVLDVHDEIVSEVLSGTVTPQQYAEVMAQELSWAPGLPLVASGEIGFRYGK